MTLRHRQHVSETLGELHTLGLRKLGIVDLGIVNVSGHCVRQGHAETKNDHGQSAHPTPLT